MATDPTTTTPGAQALLGALAARPGATAAELADAADIGRSTAGKLLARLAADGRVLRQPGGRQDGRRTADRWTLPGATTAPAHDPHPEMATVAATTDPIPAAGRPATRSGRLRPGELRDLVVGCLADRPGQALSPTAIAKALGRSAGAVGNALRVLAGQGVVVQSQVKPRMYRLHRERLDG
jgi:DNA-binding MarR family transcriptional regulator